MHTRFISLQSVRRAAEGCGVFMRCANPTVRQKRIHAISWFCPALYLSGAPQYNPALEARLRDEAHPMRCSTGVYA